MLPILLVGLAWLCLRWQDMRWQAAVGSLAVAPGTTDSYAYWVGIDSAIVIAAVYFIRGPAFGLTALALDMSALTVGMLVTGGAIPPGVWVITLTGPPIGAGVAAVMLAAFRNLSSHTESQLAAYRERLRRQARAEDVHGCVVAADLPVELLPCVSQRLAGAPGRLGLSRHADLPGLCSPIRHLPIPAGAPDRRNCSWCWT